MNHCKKFKRPSPLLQCRVNHSQELGGFKTLLFHGIARAGSDACPATLTQGIGHFYLTCPLFHHDLNGIAGAYRFAGPAAGANILIDTGNCCLGLVGIFGKDGAGPTHGSTGLSDGLINEFRGMVCACHEYPFLYYLNRRKLGGLVESMLIQYNPEFLRQFPDILLREDSHGQDHQIELLTPEGTIFN
jgi:hypothetical protein